MLDRMYNSWRPGTHGPPWASPQAEPEACSSSETWSCPGVIHGAVVIRPCGQLPTCMEMVSKTLGQKFTLNLVRFSTLFHPMRAVLGWFFSKATPEMRIWGQILYLGSTLGRSSRRWRRRGRSCGPSIVRWAKQVGDGECQPSSTQTPDWPPEHLGHRFASAFQISRDFSLVDKPNVYNTKGVNSGKRSSSWAMSMGYKTLYNSPSDCTENACSQSTKSNSEAQHFLCFPNQWSFCLRAPFWQTGEIQLFLGIPGGLVPEPPTGPKIHGCSRVLYKKASTASPQCSQVPHKVKIPWSSPIPVSDCWRLTPRQTLYHSQDPLRSGDTFVPLPHLGHGTCVQG